ncbi:MAG: GntR family transcriptional regulator [Herbinix sp.]|jgi:GntR family transcriptional regulator|nr:GntR family transcriptional regulator [Herbinix sp.]
MSVKGCFAAEHSSEDILQKRNEMIMRQMVIDTSYYKSLGLTIEEIFELVKKVY